MVRLSSIAGTRVVAALALLAAAACTDNGTSPLIVAPDVDAAASHAAGHLHTGKYRDNSAPHATGRSGSATLAARALRGADGVTRLLVTTGSVDAPQNAPGELAKVQLKVFAADGTLLSTSNYNRPSSGGSHEFLLPDVPLGARIRVQANVRGIDRNRTDVVTITETVKAAPSLSVTIDPPAQVVVGAPTVITGTVREGAGQAGAYTSCVLYVNGVEVDRVDNVWVDAGDAVTCAFTYTFPRPGTYDLEVRLEGGGSNPAIVGPPATATSEVTAVEPNPQPRYTASVVDRTVAVENRYDEWWTRPDGLERSHEQNTGDATRTQNVALTGSVARATSFPLASVDVRVWSDGNTWHSEVWSGLAAAAPDADGRLCVNKLVPEQGAHFYLCSTGSGVGGTTAFGYTRFSGTVTYHSRVFGRLWDPVVGQETFWSWNNVDETNPTGGQHRVLGSGLGLRLEVTDGVGPILVNAAIPLTSFDTQETLVPYACRTLLPYWLLGGVQTICEGRTQRTYGRSGEVSG